MKGSPLLRDTFGLCGVLLDGVRAPESPVEQRLAEGALRLLDHVSLALAGFSRAEQVRTADAELCMLRSHLLLAFELGLLAEEPFLALSEQADQVGRQLGGWLKRLVRCTHEEGLACS